MIQKWPHLNSPFSIKNVELRNRLVFQPHMTHLGRDEGPSEDHLAYYEERAAGGAGLIIFGSQAVHPTGRISHKMINAWDRKNLKSYGAIVEAVHRHGTRFFSQLTHCGPDNLEQRPGLLWGPSAIPEPSLNTCPKEMEKGDIEEVVEGFAQSARNMQDAGFDGVEIKVGHDGLLRAFASPYLNRRTDGYGTSLDGRMRLTVDVLRSIRAAVGSGFVVGARVCLQENTSWGYDLEYGLAMAKHIEDSGLADYLNCDAGTPASYWMQIPPAAIAEGSLRHLNAELKRRSRLPVISFGRIKQPDMAEAMIARGETDLVGMARQLIADPETPRKIAEGRADEIRFCMASNDSCIYEVLLGNQIRCDHNPAAGRERLFSERYIKKSDDPKSVIVVGGGPAGMKAAETLTRRGHHVMLFERGKELGGQVNLAGRQPYHVDILESTSYLERMLRKLRVEVYLGANIDAADISDAEADAIVLATGSRPVLPEIGEDRPMDPGGSAPGGISWETLPGMTERPFVVSADAVLGGEVPEPRRAVVIDGSGHWEAAGTAEFLRNEGADVWVVTSRELAGARLEGANRELFYKRAAEKEIRIITAAQVSEARDAKVTIQHAWTDKSTVLEDIDIIVGVQGRLPDQDLFLALRERGEGRPIYRVGDCVAPRLLRATITEAYEWALQL